MMVRGFILLSTLLLSVLFKLFKDYEGTVYFPFSSETLNKQSFIYYLMEHTIAIAYALCIINPRWLKDSTPQILLYWFGLIIVADMIHFRLAYRDLTAGFNIAKIVFYGVPLVWFQLNLPLPSWLIQLQQFLHK